MNGIQLLCIRVKQNWTYQYKIMKSVVDWTVFVYFVIPLTVITIAIYKSWWEELPNWIHNISFYWIFIVFFLFFWGNHFRTYVKEADSIFLRKNEVLLLHMRRWGIIYSYIYEIVLLLFSFVFIAPFWFQHYGYNLHQLLLFGGLCLSIKWVIMGIKGKLNVEVTGWRTLISGIPLLLGTILVWSFCYQAFINNQIAIILGITITLTIVSIILIWPRYKDNHRLEQDLAIDRFEKTKIIDMIFSLSMDIEKMPKRYSSRKSPVTFSKSGRIFNRRTPKNGFLELFMKVNARNIQYITGYFQIIGITSAATIILPPMWLKITIIIAGSLFLLSWINSLWDKIIGNHPFTKKYKNEEGYFAGRKQLTIVLVIPFVIFISLSMIFNIWIRSKLPFI